MSISIPAPAVSNIDEHSSTSSTFTIGPLYTGYGMTLGNSLRRVLLSSIRGAAITAVRIEGVSHEFTTVKGLREDVVDIILNLKGIRIKLFGDGPKMLRLTKKGKGAVTAQSIDKDAEIEIINPTHLIATIDDDKTTLVMDLVAESGRGYRLADENQSGRTADMLNLDAIFSPVLRVRYRVENTRVEQMTDLDRLLLTIDTDGSLSPREAFEEAAAILAKQYGVLAGQSLSPSDTAASSPQPVDDDAGHLTTAIEDLNFSARTANALINNDIHNLNDLFALSESELKELKGFGSKAFEEVREKLAELEP